MKLLLYPIFLFPILLCCLACGTDSSRDIPPPSSNGKLKVFCTIAMIEELVKEIGAQHVDTTTLISGQLDPHSYQLIKGDDEKLLSADVIFYNGLELEHGPSLKSFLSDSPKAFSLGDFLKKQFPEQILYYHEAVDPHVWMDMSLWAKNISYIVEILAEKDPVHATDYKEHGAQLEKTLLSLHQELLNAMTQVPQQKRYLVTSHDAFRYFTRAYLAEPEEKLHADWEKRFVAPEGLAPESQISPNDIRRTLDHIKKYGIHVLFPESNVSQASIKKLVDGGEKMGLHIRIAKDTLYGDAMGPPNASGNKYAAMIKHNVQTIIKWISKEDERD